MTASIDTSFPPPSTVNVSGPLQKRYLSATRAFCCLAAIGVVGAIFALRHMAKAPTNNPTGIILCVVLLVLACLAAVGARTFPRTVAVTICTWLLVAMATSWYQGLRLQASCVSVFFVAALLGAAHVFRYMRHQRPRA